MRVHVQLAAMTVISLLATAAQANGQGFGPCISGFADDTLVQTESRGEMTIGQVQVNDRVWSFNKFVGKPGWSKVLQRIDTGQGYRLLSDFTEPHSSTVTKACWQIARN